MRAALLAKFADWHPRLLNMLRNSDGGFVDRPLFALPVPHTWAHTPGLTLLGDAAHLMSPYSGTGANMAMLDAADLANELATQSDVDTAVRDHEASMSPRGVEAAEGAAEGIERAISPDAPRSALDYLSHPRRPQ